MITERGSLTSRKKLKYKKGGKEMKTLKSSKGFTLIEIIAVLVILGILAAVGVPKYIDMQGEAKKAAAKGQIAEMKSTLNLAYAKQFLAAGAAPTIAEVKTAANIGTSMGTAPDIWTVAVGEPSGNALPLTVSAYNGISGYTASGTWTLPPNS